MFWSEERADNIKMGEDLNAEVEKMTTEVFELEVDILPFEALNCNQSFSAVLFLGC